MVFGHEALRWCGDRVTNARMRAISIVRRRRHQREIERDTADNTQTLRVCCCLCDREYDGKYYFDIDDGVLVCSCAALSACARWRADDALFDGSDGGGVQRHQARSARAISARVVGRSLPSATSSQERQEIDAAKRDHDKIFWARERAHERRRALIVNWIEKVHRNWNEEDWLFVNMYTIYVVMFGFQCQPADVWRESLMFGCISIMGHYNYETIIETHSFYT